MVRVTGALLAGLIVMTTVTGAADTPAPPAGAWKIVIGNNSVRPLWLMKLESKDNKWTASVTQGEKLPKTTVDKLSVDKDVLRFTLKVGKEALQVEAKVPKEGDKMLGTVVLPDKQMAPLRMERTALPDLESYSVNKEIVAQPVGSPDIIDAALELLEAAGEKKAKPEEVRAWADKAAKTAEMHGPRWQRQTILAIAQLLSDQEGFANIAVTYARQAERLLDPKDKGRVQKQVLEVLAKALEKAGKADDVKEVQERIKKIDVSFQPEPFAGRKGKSDRAVVVELFTGAECPPCVAADMAFDALGKAFKPSEVILLQHHLHVPGPDPLTSPDTISRSRFFGNAIRGTPTLLINGVKGPAGGGGADDAEDKFDEYVAAIEPLLETPAGTKIKLTATQKGDKIDINAEVSDAAKTGDEIRLRLVLVEEAVNYAGGNKLSVHHHVVRAFPGGTEGTVVNAKTLKKAVTVDLEEVRKSANEYLDKFAKENPFPKKDRPLEMKKLKVVAFVQNDDDGEILQGAQVDVK
jgi:hypothetical protein